MLNDRVYEMTYQMLAKTQVGPYNGIKLSYSL